MENHDRLSSLIFSHWQKHQPNLLRQLQRENRLQQALTETADRFTDLLFELLSVRKMEFHEAWEIAIHEILSPEQSSSTNPKKDPLVTSA